MIIWRALSPRLLASLFDRPSQASAEAEKRRLRQTPPAPLPGYEKPPANTHGQGHARPRR